MEIHFINAFPGVLNLDFKEDVHFHINGVSPCNGGDGDQSVLQKLCKLAVLPDLTFVSGLT